MAFKARVGQITARPRQAFLLVGVEGFSEEGAARILDVDASTLRKLVEESGRQLAAQIAASQPARLAAHGRRAGPAAREGRNRTFKVQERLPDADMRTFVLSRAPQGNHRPITGVQKGGPGGFLRLGIQGRGAQYLARPGA